MNKLQTIEVMMLVKAVWPKTSVNDLVVDVWADLMSGLDFDATREAVKAFARLPEQIDPPHIGALIDYAENIQNRHRAKLARLPEPQPTEAEIAEGKARLKKMIDEIGDNHD